MFHRRVALSILIALLASLACTGSSVSLFSEPDVDENTASNNRSSEGEPSELSNSGFPAAGRLVVMGVDGNLYLYERGKNDIALTRNAIAFDASSGRRRIYAHPSWSPDGWLSYVMVETDEDGNPRLEVMAMMPGQGDPQTVLVTDSNSYIYGYWSPAICDQGSDCGRFAFLMTDDRGLDFHLVEVTSDVGQGVKEDIIGMASPFYFSWSPDGEQMLWFRDGDNLSIYDIGEDDIIDRLPDSPGQFQAPGWSPVDGRLLFARADDGANQLALIDGNQHRELGDPQEGMSFFNWSPDGDYIALASGDFPLANLTVMDSDGRNAQIYTELDPIVSFFWSPDSSKIAVVTLKNPSGTLPEASTGRRFARPAIQSDDEIKMVWSIVDINSGEITRLVEFFPTREQFYIFQFFDQYAQSHRVWSPDSRYIVYADFLFAERQSVIRLIDTTAENPIAITLREGLQAVFSFE